MQVGYRYIRNYTPHNHKTIPHHGGVEENDMIEKAQKIIDMAYTVAKIYAMFWLGTLMWCGVRISYDILREWHFWFT